MSESNQNRTMNQTAWSSKEQKNGKNGGYGRINQGNRDTKPFDSTKPYGNTKPFGTAKPSAPGGRDYKEKKPYGARTGYGGGFGKDDDYETDNKRGKNHGNGGIRQDMKSKTPNKEKELQPDKMETIKRLEKEKKALERKNQELEREKQNKPQAKKRRTGNIDWTKGYAKGLYGEDDEEDYTDFF